MKLWIKKIRFYFKCLTLKVLNKGELHFGGFVDIQAGVTIRVVEGGRLEIGKGVVLSQGTFIWVAGVMKIGKRVFINRNSYVACAESIKIDDYVMVADCVSINDSDHVLSVGLNEPRIDKPLISKPVVIGQNAWLASKCTILKGVTIEPCAIIAAGAVVTTSVPKKWIYAGVPAKPVRELID